jgi:hypothetical protein
MHTGRAPAAIIWLSGLGGQNVEQGLEELTKRIAFSCDRRAAAEATFAVRTALQPENVGGGAPVPRCTILRTDAAGSPPILDLYALPVAQSLIGDRADRSLPSQLWFAFRAVARVAPKAWKTRKLGLGKTRRERWQLSYARSWFVVMILGLVGVLGSLVATIAVTDLPLGLKFLQGGIMFVGGLSIWKSAFAKRIGSAALTGYSVVDYLDRGDDIGSQLRGQMAALLEHLGELKPPYESIDVVAYSFGSIVAIDTLFPHAQDPPPRLATIDTLITIACPFDFVRSYWNDYFTRRFSRAGAPDEWINVYAPSDVLASNFRNDPELNDSIAGIGVREGQAPAREPTNVAYLIDGQEKPVSGKDFFLLKGLRFHAQYWSSRVASEEGVFDEVIAHIGTRHTSL